MCSAAERPTTPQQVILCKYSRRYATSRAIETHSLGEMFKHKPPNRRQPGRSPKPNLEPKTAAVMVAADCTLELVALAAVANALLAPTTARCVP